MIERSESMSGAGKAGANLSDLLCVRCRACRQCSEQLSDVGYCEKCQETHEYVASVSSIAADRPHFMWRKPTEVSNSAHYYQRFDDLAHLSARDQKEDLFPDEGDNH